MRPSLLWVSKKAWFFFLLKWASSMAILRLCFSWISKWFYPTVKSCASLLAKKRQTTSISNYWSQLSIFWINFMCWRTDTRFLWHLNTKYKHLTLIIDGHLTTFERHVFTDFGLCTELELFIFFCMEIFRKCSWHFLLTLICILVPPDHFWTYSYPPKQSP